MDVLGAEAESVSADPLSQSLQQLWLSGCPDTIYDGINEIPLNAVAERALGMPRSSARPGPRSEPLRATVHRPCRRCAAL